MANYSLKILKKELVANETMAFHIEKPADFEFRAGQFADFTLIDPPETDEEGNTRAFSLVTPPSADYLEFATRLRDTAFKRVLRNLPEGSEIKFEGPFGNYVLHQDASKPAVFLIGGIGITPVHSMVAHATFEKLPHQLTLIFANKTPEDTPFFEDLKEFSKQNPNFTFVPVMTRATPEEWDGETGHVDSALLHKYITDINLPIYYLSGPAGMVKSMRDLLVAEGVSEDNIKTEEFPGY